MNIEEIINLKELKKYIEKNFGKKCKDYSLFCPICRSWKIYEDLESYMDYIEVLDKAKK